MIPLAIPSSGPLFEGHFPGRPILPGIGLLDLALRALGDAARDGAHTSAHAGAGLRAVETLRLRSLVRPGDRLGLDATPSGPGGAMRLEVRRGAEIVAGGVVIPGSPDRPTPVAGAATGQAMRVADSPGTRQETGAPDFDRLLPHRPPMRFVTAIEAEREDGIACLARVPSGSPFAPDGEAPALVAIEMAAQAAAVFEALRRVPPAPRPGGPPAGPAQEAGPRIGYLVGARGVRFFSIGFPAGADCRVAIRLSGLAGPLSTYRFEVTRAGEPAAEGAFSTWITTTTA